jgi:hypothetical protein
MNNHHRLAAELVARQRARIPGSKNSGSASGEATTALSAVVSFSVFYDMFGGDQRFFNAQGP